MDAYSQIMDKINAFKKKFPSLRAKPDYYIFSALCVEAHFYKNPENVLNESDLEEIIVDGCGDGGADIILSDPDSETCDLIIGQSKFCKKISRDEVFNALPKKPLASAMGMKQRKICLKTFYSSDNFC